MQAGRLNTRVTLQRRTAGQDAAGQPIDGWADVATTWADFPRPAGPRSHPRRRDHRHVACIMPPALARRPRPRHARAGRQPAWAIVSVQPDVGRRPLLTWCWSAR